MGTEGLVVLVPTRERPHKIAELIDAFLTTRRADSHLCVVVDYDDPTRKQYWDVVPANDPDVTLILVTGGNMVAALNEAAVDWVSQGPTETPYAVAFMGDDHRPRTVGWDEQYLQYLRAMGTGFVYGNDTIHGHHLPTQVAMTADIIQELGWMAPPTLQHLWVDNAWLALGRGINRMVYLSDVVVEHMHPIAGKADWDDRYKTVNSGAQQSRDEDAYTQWINDLGDTGYPACVDQLRTMAETKHG